MAHSLKKELIDQSAHFGAAFLFLAPLIAFPCWASAMFAGFGYAFVRELTEEGTPVTLEKIKNVFRGSNNLLDLAGWTLGGLAAWLLLH